MSPDERYMRLAIEKAKEGIAAGQLPFGAVIVCRPRTNDVCASSSQWLWAMVA